MTRTDKALRAGDVLVSVRSTYVTLADRFFDRDCGIIDAWSVRVCPGVIASVVSTGSNWKRRPRPSYLADNEMIVMLLLDSGVLVAELMPVKHASDLPKHDLWMRIA